MTTGEGGMIVTDDESLAQHCRRFRNFGDVGKFDWAEFGFHFRMPEVMGAVGLKQLEKLPRAIEERRRIAGRYNEGLGDVPGIVLPRERHPLDANYQLYTVRLDDGTGSALRDRVREGLTRRGVGNRLYYPPMHSQGVFSAFPDAEREFPNTEQFARTAISLPIFPGLTNDEQQYVIDSFLDSLNH